MSDLGACMTDATSASSQLRIQTACSLVSSEGQSDGEFPSEARVTEIRPKLSKVVGPVGVRDERPLRRVAALSPAMQQATDVLERLARAEVTVTLIGETGTGKDVLARNLHQRSRRVRGPFVVF